MIPPEAGSGTEWPELRYADWAQTLTTLNLWTQVVGKVRLALEPALNHWWHVPLFVTARGLTTGAMPYRNRALQIDFDLLDHRLLLAESGGLRAQVELHPRSVADFHDEVMGRLGELGTPVRIWTTPVETASTTPLDEDREHASYDAPHVERFFRALLQADRVMKRFRSGFRGKASPVHFFWGSFDHAVTRFSGRAAPRHPGGIPNLADWVTRESYDAELTSCGFWPGSDRYPHAAFYAYAYPAPAGFGDAPIEPAAAEFSTDLGEFILPYDAARAAADPDSAVLAFFESAHAAAAELGGWDRSLERRPAEGDVPLRSTNS